MLVDFLLPVAIAYGILWLIFRYVRKKRVFEQTADLEREVERLRKELFDD